MLVQQSIKQQLKEQLYNELIRACADFQLDPSAINYQDLEVAMRYWQNYKKNCRFANYRSNYAISSVEEFKARTDALFTEAYLRSDATKTFTEE